MPLGAAVVGAVVVVRHQMRVAATLDALATAVDSDFPIPHKRQRQADGVLFELKPRRVGLGLPPLFPSPESRSHPLSNQTRRTQPIAPPRFVHLPASKRNILHLADTAMLFNVHKTGRMRSEAESARDAATDFSTPEGSFAHILPRQVIGVTQSSLPHPTQDRGLFRRHSFVESSS